MASSAGALTVAIDARPGAGVSIPIIPAIAPDSAVPGDIAQP